MSNAVAAFAGLTPSSFGLGGGEGNFSIVQLATRSSTPRYALAQSPILVIVFHSSPDGSACALPEREPATAK